MQSFAVVDRLLRAIPGPVVTDLRRVDTGRGREDLHRRQAPLLLTELAARARVASITASSALEGVVVPDEARAARILDGRARILRTRSEQEFAGYRTALDYLFTEDWRPLNVGLVQHLHRLLFTHTPTDGGSFKHEDNLVVDRSPDGTVEVRFVPVAAAQTEWFMVELIDRYRATAASEQHHPVLVVGLFVLDLLTIHPFEDGNGRVARALTNALLAEAGHEVGRYVSLEQLIAERADDYYASLLASTHGWHEGAHDPWPWLVYFVSTLAAAYERFERGASAAPSISKQDRVRRHVLEQGPEYFTVGQIRAALPGISDPTIRLALASLRHEERIVLVGGGRAARWRRLP